MAWVRLDDHLPDHDKLAHCGDYAPLCGWLFVCGLAFCNRQLTDGRIPKPHIPKLANFRHIHIETGGVGKGRNQMVAFTDEVTPEHLADLLVEVGLWEDDGNYYVIHDYLDYQPSRAHVLAERERFKVKRQGTHGGTHAGTHGGTPSGTPAERTDVRPDVPFPIPNPIPKIKSDNARAREAPTPANGTPLADDVWQAWCAVAKQHGTNIVLTASHRETLHLMELAAAYTLDDLQVALRAWWASPYVPSRSVGLFKSQIADVLAHVASGSTAAFRAPPGERAKAVKAVPPGGGWTCPHTPRCERRWACERKTQTAALVGAREEA